MEQKHFQSSYRLGMGEPEGLDRGGTKRSAPAVVADSGAGHSNATDGQEAQGGLQPRDSIQSRGRHSGAEILQGCLTLLQGAVAVSLLVVAAVVLVRTLATFLDQPSDYPTSLISALDGILVVIIIVDILHTVVTHLRDTRVPVRPFLVIGVLAGIRDVLSASARLELTGHQSTVNFNQSVIELGVGVGVVLVLLAGLVMLRFASGPSDTESDV